MQRRESGFLALLVLVLAACSSGGDGVSPAPVIAGGAVELAVSRTCDHGSDRQCVIVNDKSVLVVPTDFERAGVHDVAVTTDEGRDVLHLQFDDDGAAVLQETSARAAADGPESRLLLKVGEHVLSAATVPEGLDGDEVRVTLPADAQGEELVDAIRSA